MQTMLHDSKQNHSSLRTQASLSMNVAQAAQVLQEWIR